MKNPSQLEQDPQERRRRGSATPSDAPARRLQLL